MPVGSLLVAQRLLPSDVVALFEHSSISVCAVKGHISVVIIGQGSRTPIRQPIGCIVDHRTTDLGSRKSKRFDPHHSLNRE